MPTFDTPDPISVTIELGAGDIRILAGERGDTVVEVRPSNPASGADVALAEQTRVEYANGRLLVKAPKGWKHYPVRDAGPSIDVQIELPAGSSLHADTAAAALRCSGRLGELQARNGVGDVELEQVGSLQLRSGAGDLTVNTAVGKVELTTGSGKVRIEHVDGSAVVKNANGVTWIGEVTGELRAHAANGDLTVDLARASVSAKSAKGDIRLGQVSRGNVVAETAFGTVEVGVLDGVAVWLDLHTAFGSVHNGLDDAERPARNEDTVQLRARTAYGDVRVRRVTPDLAGSGA